MGMKMSKVSKSLLFCIILVFTAGYFVVDMSIAKIVERKISKYKKSKPQNLRGLVINDKNNFDILLMGDKDFVSDIIFEYKSWEDHLQNVLKQVVKPQDKVLVLGAHIGYHAVLISNLVGSKGEVYVFEPNPNTLKFLRANLALNNVTNTTIYPKAAYSKNTSLPFVAFTEGNTGHSHIPYLDEKRTDNFITVDAVSIDTVNQIKSIDVLQMDIEGAEVQAVYGAQRLIDNSPNLIVLQEWCPKFIDGDIDQYLKFWRSRGYEIAQITGVGLKKMDDEQLKASELIDIILAKNLQDIIVNFSSL
jgi:FkbM family methyltransferase